MPREWRGSRVDDYYNFPMLVKLIFPEDKLSIQVHPDDAYASKHEQSAGGRGKTEMWHVVSAEPNAQVFIGLKPGVDQCKFRDSLNHGRIEELFRRHPVHAGDSFFIPAGTPHTMGAGMIICEVQEYSDLTYRIYDYGRLDANGKPRELHIQKALEVIRFGDSMATKTRAITLRAKAPNQRLLAACRYFAAELWETSAPIEAESETGCFDLLTILAGQGTLAWNGGAANYRPGECWFKPALLQRVTIRPNEKTVFMRAYLPELSALRPRLQKQGASEEAMSKVVFD
jgi:mannose-6-phosphate isomerase